MAYYKIVNSTAPVNVEVYDKITVALSSLTGTCSVEYTLDVNQSIWHKWGAGDVTADTAESICSPVKFLRLLGNCTMEVLGE